MSIQGVYYLLEDGRLVYQPAPPECVGAVRAWGIDVSDRYDFWLVAVEALALGVEPERICELMEKWGLTDEDGQEFARRSGVVLEREGDLWRALWGSFSPLHHAGEGPTVLDALAALVQPRLIGPVSKS